MINGEYRAWTNSRTSLRRGNLKRETESIIIVAEQVHPEKLSKMARA